MPSNEERREVAARLRRYAAVDMENAFDCLLHTAINYTDRCGPECTQCRESICNSLADLIEPEERTCRNVGCYSDSTRFKCSECEFNGWVKWAKDGKDRVPGYCPNCGAKAVEQ